jgi:hypothetical protein
MSTSSLLLHDTLHMILIFYISFTDFLLLLDGFFDAGMLQQALKANRGEADPAAERDVIRRNIGRRLKLAEY